MRLLLLIFLTFGTVHAFTVKDYLALRKTGAEHGFLSGYIASIYDNIYFFGGCKVNGVSLSVIQYNNIRLDMDLKIDRMLSIKMIGEDILERSLSIILIPIIKDVFNCNVENSLNYDVIESSEGRLYKEFLFNSFKENEKYLKQK